jgi:fumarate reductase flavoprotein subunit
MLDREQGNNRSGSLSRRGFLTAALAAGATVATGSLVACGGTVSNGGGTNTETTSDSGDSATDWLGKEPVIADSSITDTVDTEILIIGAGNGGLFCACAAGEKGSRVVVMEKEGKSGTVRDDLGAANSRYQQADGCVIDKQAMAHDMYHYANGYCNQKLHMEWYDNSAEAINWYGDVLADNGIVLWHEAANENPDKVSLFQHWATGHSPAWPADGSLDGATVLTNQANKTGNVIFMYETPMVKLIHDDGAVTGAIGQTAEGTYVRVNASKGVVVCTGGYARNDDMLTALQPQTQSVFALNLAPVGCTGDGIKACLWAGADMDGTNASMLFDRGALKPDAVAGKDAESSLFWMGSQPWLKVNLDGERFTNEGGGVYDYILHAATSQPGNTYCTIYDSNYGTYAKQFDMHGCSRLFPFDNGAPSNMTLDQMKGMNQGLLDKGFIQQADTIEELADKLEIPSSALAATVKRNNELYANQLDEDFGKEWFRLSPVNTPPYYGVRQTGNMLCTLNGIVINTDFQAMKPDGTPIEGLYVDGNDSGCYYATSYPNQSTGNACGRTVTFGRMLGKALAAK